VSAGGDGVREELWARADALFDELLALGPEEREHALSASEAPAEVLARVRRLLALDTRAEGFLEGVDALERTIASEALDAATSSVRQDIPTGTPIGRYRVTGVLGRGGTSTVYRAARADGTFEQEIAIKVVRADLQPEALARRMRAERQILAKLSHPNLASVFDGGLTADGRPWLGVELVEGIRIDEWANARRLTVDARVRLFLQVLAAVQHAHRNLVVHRDLKPSNILVTGDGVVKLLDFGVAKLLESEGAEGAGFEETRPAEGRWLTPAYAAPEQILGEPVTTATDIHALGVVLYELLAGQRPFVAEGDATYPLERAICETEPTSPSTAVRRPHDTSTDPASIAKARSVSEAELRRSLGGDLDAIILRALRKNPEDRYASAEAMADDLSRHLEGLPVSARGDAAAYRIGTFARRNKVPVAAAALLFLTVTGSAIALALSRGALIEARADAEAEAAQSAAAVAFLSDVFRGSDPDVAPVGHRHGGRTRRVGGGARPRGIW
jgi:predicted Ser/Thr protein kinase